MIHDFFRQFPDSFKSLHFISLRGRRQHKQNSVGGLFQIVELSHMMLISKLTIP